MRATHAWAVTAAFIVAYEVLCDPDELMTRGLDRGRSRSLLHSVAIATAVGSTAVHLLGYRGRLDPFQAISAVRQVLHGKEPDTK